MKLLRKILFPFNALYYLVVWFRNQCYDWGLLKSKSYDLPIICVGNLSVGGTGKTPMVEFLIQLLQSHFRVAVLSRGYARKSKGFVLADDHSTAQSIGDEPFQMSQKFPNTIFAVDANRQNGIERLQTLDVGAEIIILDDAFQHRRVVPGLSILLTSYGDLYCDDFVLPSGNLREPRSGAKRAQVVVVTKCPIVLDKTERKFIKKRLNLTHDQMLFFSSIVYSDIVISKSGSRPLKDLKSQRITLVTGIANPSHLTRYLQDIGLDFEHLQFADHHEFSESELDVIASKSIVLTTEKDFSRLQSVKHPNLFYIPISIQLFDQERFGSILKGFVSKAN